MKNLALTCLVTGAIIAGGCGEKKNANHNDADTTATKTNQQVDLPAPYETESVAKYCKVIGWPEGKMPIAPEGFTVTLFADSLRNPRNIYVAANGDIFVSEANTEPKGVKKFGAALKGMDKSQNMGKSANDILLFRDTNGDGKYDLKTVFVSGLNQPYGIEIIGDWFYVANTDGVWRFPYKAGQTKMEAAGKMILDLPAGGYNNHWTRNLLAAKDGKKLFISVGSGSNVAEHGMNNEIRRANILEINPDGSGERIYAAGLRNPVGMDWGSDNKLYTVVNERDKLGDELVPDYMTAVQQGAFYGWPYAYFGNHEDPSFKGTKKPDLVEKTVVPDVALGSHTASLGLAFYNAGKFPAKYKGGAFIGQHGSWNSSKWVGYKVIYAPFNNGKPTGQLEDFLTGFIADAEKGEVYGRPVEIGVLKDGSILVTDDAANRIWRVTAK